MIKKINIGPKTIGDNFKPFIIAEISANHSQSLDKAKKLIRAAAKSGVDAVKLQTFMPEDLTLDVDRKDFKINDKKSLWHGYKLFDLYKKAFTPWEWHKPLFKLAKELKLISFSSVFDEESVDKLNNIGVPAFKIASFENNHLPLIKKVLDTQKPVIISLGASTRVEINDLVKLTKNHKNKKVIFLKCTSIYPSDHNFLNLKSIKKIKSITKSPVGFSDHTRGVSASISAIALGANVIEKHFKDINDKKSLDSEFSIDVNEMKLLVKYAKESWQSIGHDNIEMSIKEKNSRIFKRSIYISKKILPGQKITKKNIKIVRPGYSLEPKHLNLLIGKKFKKIKYPGDRIKMNEIYK
jgi:pseudaminic acid synthase|tara:strand:+ start:3557 stop:4615 length:1059 start_codon:yes stop_codon:yes gene_type:complete